MNVEKQYTPVWQAEDTTQKVPYTLLMMDYPLTAYYTWSFQ